jgi:hypothetical protein
MLARRVAVALDSAVPQPWIVRRLRVLMKREETTDANAVRAKIERDAAVRARIQRACLNGEAKNTCLYEVRLDAECLSVETCVSTIAELAERRGFRYRAMRSALGDKLTEARIRSAFAEHISRSMAPLGVSVSVRDRKVRLDGISSSGGLRRRAEEIARTISGTLPIDNRIVSVPSRGRPWPMAMPGEHGEHARSPSFAPGVGGRGSAP